MMTKYGKCQKVRTVLSGRELYQDEAPIIVVTPVYKSCKYSVCYLLLWLQHTALVKSGKFSHRGIKFTKIKSNRCQTEGESS